MNFYFAPLEGLGGYIYRNAQADLFVQADKYFAPFLSPGAKKRLTPKALRDIVPEHNPHICLVPQIMTNDANAFLETARELEDLGYREVNLNLGCPSKTVVNKGRGAGFLADPDALDRFLDGIFFGAGSGEEEIRISVKTRIGMQDPEEFVRLLGIYNQYPMEELIIHPRIQTDYYRNRPNREMFSWALEHTDLPVVYNGDLFCAADFMQFHEAFPEVGTVMIGRGVLCDPALFGELWALLPGPPASGKDTALTKERLWAFHERLLSDYAGVLSGESHVLFKMKELWYYMIHVFSDAAKYAKEIRKVQKLSDYREIIRRLFEEREIQESDFC